MRMVVETSLGIVVYNIGEGTNEKQADGAMFADPIKNYWIGHTQEIIDGLKGGGFVIY